MSYTCTEKLKLIEYNVSIILDISNIITLTHTQYYIFSDYFINKINAITFSMSYKSLNASMKFSKLFGPTLQLDAVFLQTTKTKKITHYSSASIVYSTQGVNLVYIAGIGIKLCMIDQVPAIFFITIYIKLGYSALHSNDTESNIGRGYKEKECSLENVLSTTQVFVPNCIIA